MSRSEFVSLIEEWSSGYRKLHLLRAAIELGIFEELYEGKKSAKEVSIRIGGNERLVGIMLECLAKEGLVLKEGELFTLSEFSKVYLCKNSKFSQLNFLRKLFADLEVWQEASRIVRDGPKMLERGTFSQSL